MVLFRGRSEGQSLLTMEGWYNSIREPELSLESRDIGPAVALSCAEMALSGTTTFCDQYFFADEIAAAVRQAGIRAVIAYGIVQLGDKARGKEELARAKAFLEQQRSADGRIIPWFGPHAPYVDNSEDLLLDEVAIAREYGVGLHLHMAAGPEDNERDHAALRADGHRRRSTATASLPAACTPPTASIFPTTISRSSPAIRRRRSPIAPPPACAQGARACARRWRCGTLASWWHWAPTMWPPTIPTT